MSSPGHLPGFTLPGELAETPMAVRLGNAPLDFPEPGRKVSPRHGQALGSYMQDMQLSDTGPAVFRLPQFQAEDADPALLEAHLKTALPMKVTAGKGPPAVVHGSGALPMKVTAGKGPPAVVHGSGDNIVSHAGRSQVSWADDEPTQPSHSPPPPDTLAAVIRGVEPHKPGAGVEPQKPAAAPAPAAKAAPPPAMTHMSSKEGGGVRMYGQALMSLASVAGKKGQLRKATALMWKARKAFERGGEDRDVISTDMELAAMFESVGEFDKALTLYDKTLSFTNAKFGRESEVSRTVLKRLEGCIGRLQDEAANLKGGRMEKVVKGATKGTSKDLDTVATKQVPGGKA
eukprot:CAMPEP_0175995074 /NCGR_PEP_ID=MMETSP0108-20121206/54937_1 /TAXON_ID=195067 ORGANISM="Goniomonas pacifica, Strain CCMP1869" /NCGR_SAMPLE_ID=MMETSP0108 /ASSEMBLY_ACC=CAM_ASM_000204 /LENGTH=344 /DNA_ID=CAMNT_0017327171 /DNA_START=8 /DNA_END=1039 /DNA_ORIENTATION=-